MKDLEEVFSPQVWEGGWRGGRGGGGGGFNVIPGELQ